MRTVGVEEEFLLVDPSTGTPQAVAGAVVEKEGPDGDLTGELQHEQLETGTRPCRDLTGLHAELRRTRQVARDAAAAEGADLVALAISPLPAEPHVRDEPRYARIMERFGRTAREQLTCGCHVHVGVESDDEGVQALDRIRPWLAPLLAISTNSPYWDGADSGYASFRQQVWGRWPSAGPTGVFGSADRYREVTGAMLATDTVLDDGMLYFDARLSTRHPTVEIRVADVCLDADDAVLIAGLTRALVERAVRDASAGIAPDPVRTEVLRLAEWRAARSGLDGDLLDPRTWRPASARDVLDALLEHVREPLEDAGDLPVVRKLAEAVLERGTGAARQRAVFRRTGDLRAVVAAASVR